MNNKIIVFGNTLYNTLGRIRSIGEKGLPVFLILEPGRKADCFVRFSRYLKKVHYSRSLEDGLEILKREYGAERASARKRYLEVGREIFGESLIYGMAYRIGWRWLTDIVLYRQYLARVYYVKHGRKFLRKMR